MTAPTPVEPTSPGSESDLDALRRLLGTDGIKLVERLDRIAHDPESEGTAEAHEVAGDLATWVLVTYRQLVRDTGREWCIVECLDAFRDEHGRTGETKRPVTDLAALYTRADALDELADWQRRFPSREFSMRRLPAVGPMLESLARPVDSELQALRRILADERIALACARGTADEEAAARAVRFTCKAIEAREARARDCGENRRQGSGR